MPNKDRSDLAALFNLTPERAKSFLEDKGQQVTWNWWEMQGEAHNCAFTVAKLTNVDALRDTQQILTEAIDQGLPERAIAKHLEAQYKQAGWWGPKVHIDPDTGEAQVIQAGSRHRIKTIIRNNLSQSYNAGKRAQFLEEVEEAPFWQYLAVRDSNSRPDHRKFHGKVFRATDPIWGIIYPSNGHGCRCGVRNFSQRELDKRGLKVEEGAEIVERDFPGNPPKDKLTGETPPPTKQRGVRIPDPDSPSGWAYLWADRGWDYAPGDTPCPVRLAELIDQRAGAVLSPAVTQQIINEVRGNGS